MAITELAEDLWLIPGMVNVYVLSTADGLAVLDTGFPGRAPKILQALREIGKAPQDVRHIVLTHCHPDHIGSAAALQRETGATVWAHRLDAPRIEAGSTTREPMCVSPGFRYWLLAKVLTGRFLQVEPVKVDRLLDDGESPDFAPDLRAIHIPGHCAGQLAFLWQRHGGVLFPADGCVNIRGLSLPIATEDPKLALSSIEKLAAFDFDKVCVMHGKPIMSGGAEELRRTDFDTFKKQAKV